MKRFDYILGGLAAVFVASTVYFWVSNSTMNDRFAELESDHQELKLELASSSKRIRNLNSILSYTEGELTDSQEENEDLEDDLRKEERKNEDFEDQIKEITGTVGQLDKLSKTDPELLQKYSRVFFLNEHYLPEKLIAIDKDYLYSEDEPKFLHAKVMPFFEDMVGAALDDDVNLWVVSAFRSFDTQADLKGQYLVSYGSGANTFSADQGYSEHQLGTTIDFTTNDLGGGLAGFDTTPAYEWLEKNAHRYGFVLSYPEENGYYVFEPWHWRFVGEDLADDLDDDGKHFYDLDQRDIDAYLISIFD